MREITQLRLMADDLTGALDSAASFVGLFPGLRVGHNADKDRSLVLNSASRESSAQEARRQTKALATHLAPSEGRLSFFKIDSLLRGQAAASLDALLSDIPFDSVIIAPALPALKRVTLEGRQHVWSHDTWTPSGEDLLSALVEYGHTVTKNDVRSKGLVWCDAKTDAELDQIVTQGLSLSGSVLWVGTAGLASALARLMGNRIQKPQQSTRPFLSLPLLGLIGSNHPVMRAQLAKVSALHLPSTRRTDIVDKLKSNDAVLVTCPLPETCAPDAAQSAIRHAFSTLVSALPVPACLFVSGGETLQDLLVPLRIDALELLGEVETGVPVSRITGGLWDGVSVISKSGAFGSADLLLRLVSSLNPHSKAIVA